MTVTPKHLPRHGRTGSAMPWAAAHRLAHTLPSAMPEESVPLPAAIGRALAAPLRAMTPLPGFDNAAMDGYAVCGAGPWRIVGRILAGHARDVAPLRAQTAVEIATGAPVPTGADRVVPYEAADRDGDIVRAEPDGRGHIRRAGEYARLGQDLAPAGSRVTPALLGLAASAGLDLLTVHARPRVRLVISGDELRHTGVPQWGRVRDAIGPMLGPPLSGWGAVALEPHPVGDDSCRFTAAIEDSMADAEMTIVCGASSIGPADGLHPTLRHLGALVHVDGVACRPGHPQVLAQVGSRWIVGLPGNPFAALVAALTLVDPLLAALAGRPVAEPDTATLTEAVRADHRNARIVPVRRHGGRLRLVDNAHPGYLGAAAVADALAVVPPGWRRGDRVRLLSLP